MASDTDGRPRRTSEILEKIDEAATHRDGISAIHGPKFQKVRIMAEIGASNSSLDDAPVVDRSLLHHDQLQGFMARSDDKGSRLVNARLLNKKMTSQTARQVGFGTLTEWIDGTTVQSTTDDSAGASTSFVWALYHHTLGLFSLLVPLALVRSSSWCTRQGERSLKKCLGKLFLWGDGFRNGKLESVLDESEMLRETILESLTGIGKTLLTRLAPKCLANSRASDHEKVRQQVGELEILIEKARIITESEYESDGSVISADAEAVDQLPLEITAALSTYVGCLMELLPSMEETLDSLEYHVIDESLSHPTVFEVSGPAQPYVLKVLDKFSNAELRLIQRLGEANWQRHISLRAANDLTIEGEAVQELPSSCFVPVSLFHDSGLGSSLPVKSTYAATIASHSSFKSTAADGETGELRVPATPKEVFESVPFNCQICGHLLSRIKSRIDWRRHVFADLKPYVCTFSGCQDELKIFPTRSLWEDHEFSQHRFNKNWACSSCSFKTPTSEAYCEHLQVTHNLSLSDDQYQIATRSAEVREPQHIELQNCPLCLEVPGKSRRNFVTHVGKHMESIALAALPRDEESTDSESDTSSFVSVTPDELLPAASEADSANITQSDRAQSKSRNTGHNSLQVPSAKSLERASADDVVEVPNPNVLLHSLPGFSTHALTRINKHVLENLWAKPSLKDFQSIVKECTSGMHLNEIACLRDLEKTLISMAQERAKTPALYLEFCLISLRCIQETVGFLNVTEQTRVYDRPYSNSYFVDVTDQIKQIAQHIQIAKGGDPEARMSDNKESEQNDEIRLHGGLNKNGRPAELVRVKKDGKAFSIATGLPVDLEEGKNTQEAMRFRRSLSEEAEDDESILHAMARRKRTAPLDDLAPKLCREPGCEKEFKRAYDLTKHEKTHSRPWKCPEETCRYRELGWPTERIMDRHIKEVHGAQPPLFQCHYRPCPYISKRESNCKQHMEKAHGWEYIRLKSKAKTFERIPREDTLFTTSTSEYTNVSNWPSNDKWAPTEDKALLAAREATMPPMQTTFNPAVSISANDALPVSESVDEEPYTIKCICDYSNDDGNTIYCETCDTWQHIECFYPGRVADASREEFDHFCAECKPRPLDRRHATERQRHQRQNKLLDVSPSRPSTASGQDRFDSTKSESQAKSGASASPSLRNLLS